jgi:hypothetical protein
MKVMPFLVVILLVGSVDFVATQVGESRESVFVDNGNGTVTDRTLNLMWQKIDDGRMYEWELAKSKCATLTLAGHKDWRLPTLAELETLLVPAYTRTVEFEVYASQEAARRGDRSDTKLLSRVVFINRLFEISGSTLWSSNRNKNNQHEAYSFDYYNEKPSTDALTNPAFLGVRVLCVRAFAPAQ